MFTKQAWVANTLAGIFKTSAFRKRKWRMLIAHKGGYQCGIVWRFLLLAGAIVLGGGFGGWALADCGLTTTGNVPLPDLGPGIYQGVQGGLYPNGTDIRPAPHLAAGLDIGLNRIKPLDANGNVDSANGKIVMISVGMSNATREFAIGGSGAFKPRADADPAKNPRLVIVDGAQGGRPATDWVSPSSDTWSTVNQRLTAAGVTPQQVQIAWVKQAERQPSQYGAFPAHAQKLQSDLEAIARNLSTNYPKIKIAYYSSRTRAYTNDPTALNPEPFAYEASFSTKWMIENQINGTGNLNFDSAKGPVVAPWLSWGPYLWADGTNPRSDGFTWLCSDVVSDFTHPSATGIAKVSDQLLAFFKTDPTATPWFLRSTVVGQPPTVTASANPSSGATPLMVNFTAAANDPDGTIAEYVWTFDDGTFSRSQNPVKTFPAPGIYNVHLTVTDNSGNTVARTVAVSAGTASAAIMGTVTRATNGKVIPSAAVRLKQGGTVKAQGTTNTSGIYNLDSNIPTGTYDLVVSKTGFLTKTITGLALTAGKTVTQNVLLSSSARITGAVTKVSDGTVIPGATVKLQQGGTIKAQGTTSTSGIYRLGTDILTGTYDLVVSKTGFVTRTITGISLTEGASTTLNVQLN